MRHYAVQLEPLMKVLLTVGYDNLSLQGDNFGQALCRASLETWLRTPSCLSANTKSSRTLFAVNPRNKDPQRVSYR